MAEDTHAESSTTVGSRTSHNSSPAKTMSPTKSPRNIDEDVPAPPPKRVRAPAVDERARSKRMFGNILGTLRRFQDDDKSKRSSEAAKRREETSQRIAAKLASETNLQNEIVDTERELRTLKVASESAAYVLEHREIALAARHTNLRVSGRYLHTSASAATDPVFDSKTALYASAPVPLARGPNKGAEAVVPVLYFLPKVLLLEQEELLRTRAAEIDKLIADESDNLRADQDAQADKAASSADKIADLSAKLLRLKEQQEAARRGSTVLIRGAAERNTKSPEKEMPVASSNGAPRERDHEMESKHDNDEEMEVEY